MFGEEKKFLKLLLTVGYLSKYINDNNRGIVV
jgi:hypothetical protein